MSGCRRAKARSRFEDDRDRSAYKAGSLRRRFICRAMWRIENPARARCGLRLGRPLETPDVAALNRRDRRPGPARPHGIGARHLQATGRRKHQPDGRRCTRSRVDRRFSNLCLYRHDRHIERMVMALDPGVRLRPAGAITHMRRTAKVGPAVHRRNYHRHPAVEVIGAQHLGRCHREAFERQCDQQTPEHKSLDPAIEPRKCWKLHARRGLVDSGWYQPFITNQLPNWMRPNRVAPLIRPATAPSTVRPVRACARTGRSGCAQS